MRVVTAIIFILFSFEVYTQNDPFLSILEGELKREMTEFAKAKEPPYYLAYRVNDIYNHRISSSFGSLVASFDDRSRVLVTEVKVGDYSFDNSHPVDNPNQFDFPSSMMGARSVQLPLDDNEKAIQFMLWQQTQRAYRQANMMYKSAKNSKKEMEKSVDDFSKEDPQVHVDPPLGEFSQFFDASLWVERVKSLSKPFLNNLDMVDGEASIDVGMERKYFVSSEGTRIAQNRTYAYITIRGSVRAEDGDIVPLHRSYFAFDPSRLPNDQEIIADVKEMISKLASLRTVNVAEPYTGPAILHARAAGVFFHEIFGHRIEGHRLKDVMDGQTFKGKIGEQVLPKSLNVVFDPTMNQYKDQDLNGFYLYDDQGVKGAKVKVVDNGTLRTFLMSRTPIEHFTQSNGHGRAQAGSEAVSRQSNLLIENEKVVPMTEMRKMLIEECNKQNKKYGYLIMDVVGGFTTTGRMMPNAFNIFPTEVYRVYADGRPDELVRGVDLIGTPLAMFAEITAADDQCEVFTGFCGAESGSIPVTAISPSLFVKRIETQKKPVTQVDKALLTMPHEN